MGVAAGPAAQRLALALVGLFDLDAIALGQPGDLLARHFQRPAVGGVGDDLALHSRVDDDALELALLYGTHIHERFDGGLDRTGVDCESSRANSSPCKRAYDAKTRQEQRPCARFWHCGHVQSHII